MLQSGDSLRLGLEDLGSLPDATDLPVASYNTTSRPLPSAFSGAAVGSEDLDDLFAMPSLLPALSLDRPPSWIPSDVQTSTAPAEGMPPIISLPSEVPAGNQHFNLGDQQQVSGSQQYDMNGSQYAAGPQSDPMVRASPF